MIAVAGGSSYKTIGMNGAKESAIISLVPAVGRECLSTRKAEHGSKVPERPDRREAAETTHSVSLLEGPGLIKPDTLWRGANSLRFDSTWCRHVFDVMSSRSSFRTLRAP